MLVYKHEIHFLFNHISCTNYLHITLTSGLPEMSTVSINLQEIRCSCHPRHTNQVLMPMPNNTTDISSGNNWQHDDKLGFHNSVDVTKCK